LKKKSVSFDEEYDVVVIGAGIGGLTCGSYLAKQGKRVQILEQHYMPGGCCSSFSRKGFKFDAGVLHLTGGKESGAFRRVLAALNIEEEIEFKEQFQKLVFPDLSYESSRDLNYLPHKLREMFPQEEEGIAALFDTIKSIYEDVRRLPELPPLLLKYKNRSFQELHDEYIKIIKIRRSSAPTGISGTLTGKTRL